MISLRNNFLTLKFKSWVLYNCIAMLFALELHGQIVFNKKIQVIPLKFAGKLILIQAQCDSLAGDFIFDTGSPILVLNSVYFKNSTIKSNSISVGTTGIGDSTISYRVDNFFLQDWEYQNITADVVNLSEIEKIKNKKILGLLGTSFFMNCRVEIDIANKQMVLIHKDSLDSELPSTTLKTLQLKKVENLLFVEGKIAKKKVWFNLDLGAEMSVLNARNNRTILDQFEILGQKNIYGTAKTKISVTSGKLGKLQIGNQTFEQTSVVLLDLEELSKAYNTEFNGVLGFDFLEGKKFCINFVNNTLSFLP